MAPAASLSQLPLLVVDPVDAELGIDHQINPKEIRMEHIEEVGALIEVAPDSTVSRTVLKAEGARVVLFAFDAGQELSEHTAAVPILLQVLDGRLRVGAGGERVELAPGGIVHIGSRVPHDVLALEPSRMVLTMLDPRSS